MFYMVPGRWIVLFDIGDIQYTIIAPNHREVHIKFEPHIEKISWFISKKTPLTKKQLKHTFILSGDLLLEAVRMKKESKNNE